MKGYIKMSESIIEIMSLMKRHIIKDLKVEKKFDFFHNEKKILLELGFSKLGIIENSFQGSHINYVLVMASKETGVDAMITSAGEITLGTLFEDNSVLDTGNSGMNMEEKGKFFYRACPGEEVKKIYIKHLKELSSPDFKNKKPVSHHLETIEEWLKTLIKTIEKLKN